MRHVRSRVRSISMFMATPSRRSRGAGLTSFAVLCLATWFAAHASSAVIHVDASAAGAGTGATWADAYRDLRLALLAATAGDEVWVAAGTYPSPGTLPGPFRLKQQVAVYGGFDGTEASLAERAGLFEQTILKGGAAPHVVTASFVDASAILDGFELVDGHGGETQLGSNLVVGGALRSESSSPTIRNCWFRDNCALGGTGFSGHGQSARGGAAYLTGGSPRCSPSTAPPRTRSCCSAPVRSSSRLRSQEECWRPCRRPSCSRSPPDQREQCSSRFRERRARP